jgi:hypothetical protein
MIYIKEQVVGRALAEKIDDWAYEIGHWKCEIKNAVLAPWRFLRNVWLFRKELWRFRRWDYKFNNDLYIRSWELSAEFYESKECIIERGPQNSANIRKFIKMLRLSEDGIPEAERIMGMNFLDLCDKADGGNICSNWMNEPQENRTQEQKDFRKMMDLNHQIEGRNWKNAWKFMSRKGQHWWE